jgi:ComF family protein
MFRDFLDLLFPPRDDELITREVSEEELLALLKPRQMQKTDPETVALLPFSDDRVRSVLHEAKYHGNEKAFALLASVLTAYVRPKDLEQAVLIPVPLGRKRLRTRGFNQVEEVLKVASKELGIPVDANALFRTKETVSQVSLPRFARASNMQGAFGVAHPLDPSHTYILVDDVVTTGATLQSALQALRSAGARNLLSIALAH